MSKRAATQSKTQAKQPETVDKQSRQERFERLGTALFAVPKDEAEKQVVKQQKRNGRKTKGKA